MIIKNNGLLYRYSTTSINTDIRGMIEQEEKDTNMWDDSPEQATHEIKYDEDGKQPYQTYLLISA